MQKIGILGGSFNPIHNGHIQLARTAYEEYDLDKVIFIPSGIAYFKKNIDMPSGNVRHSMVNLAIKGIPCFESSNMEIVRPGDTHTVDTLRELHAKFPDAELFFITGADILFSIHTWYEPKAILELTTLIVSVRNGSSIEDMERRASELKDKYNARILFLKADNFEISSTKIRELIKNRSDVSNLVPKEVENYIKDHGLYI